MKAIGNHFFFEKTIAKKCCLGFLALECGAEIEHTKGFGGPQDTLEINWPKELLFTDNKDLRVKETAMCIKLMRTNDDYLLSDKTRENLLKQKFAEIDIDVEFVDE